MLRVTIVAFFFVFLVNFDVKATIITSNVATGNWNVAGSWSPAQVPTSTDDVIIATGDVITISATGAVCNSLTINAPAANNGITFAGAYTLTVGGTLAMNGPTANCTNTISVGTGTLSAANINITGVTGNGRYCIVSVSTGTINVSGNITFLGSNSAHAQLTFTGAGILNIGGDLGSGGTFAASNGTVNCNGSAQTIAGYSYYNLTLSGSGIKTLSAGSSPILGNLTLNGTATTTTVEAFTINGNLNLGDGTTFTVAGYALSVAGTTTIGGGTSGTLSISSATGTKTFTGAVIINNGASITENASAKLSFGSDVTIYSGGTLTESDSTTVGFAGNLSNYGTYTASIKAHTFSGTTKTIGGTVAISIPTATFSGTYTNTGTLIVGTLKIPSSGMLTNSSTITDTTALSGTGGFTQLANATLNIGGTSGIATLIATASGNTVNYNASGAQTVKDTSYFNLTLSGSGKKTLPAGIAPVLGNLTLSGTANTSLTENFTINGNLGIGDGTTFTAAGYSLNVNGTTTVGGGTSGTLSITSATGTKTFTGDVTIYNGGAITETKAANLSFGSNVTIISGGALTASGAAAVNIAGNFNNSGTYIANTSTVTFNGSGQTIDGTSSTTFNNVTIALGSTTTLGIGTTIKGLTINSTFNDGGYTITLGSGNSLTMGAGGSYNIGSTAMPGWASFSLAAGSTVGYVSGINQTVSASLSYQNLTFGGAATKTLAAAITVAGALAINTGVVANLGTYTSTANTLTLGGAGQPSGSFGGMGSPAIYIDPTFFAAATGILNVTNPSCTAGTWLGDVGTDWNTTTNWCGGIPSATTDVIIPAVANQPAIGSTGGVCRNITINSGAALNITGSYALTIKGNWTNQGTFTANNSTVTFNGTGAQTIGGTTATTFYNLSIGGSSAVTLNAPSSAVTVCNNNMTIATGGSVTLDSSQYLTVTGALTNNNTGTSGLIIKNGGSLIYGSGTPFRDHLQVDDTRDRFMERSFYFFPGGIHNNWQCVFQHVLEQYIYVFL